MPEFNYGEPMEAYAEKRRKDRDKSPRFVVFGNASRPKFNPAGLGNLAAWFKFNSGITVTGSGVSQWSDATGNGNHLLQATDSARPALQADGSILFDGAADFLQCAAFTLNQPETIYLLFKQVTWTINDVLFDGNAGGSGALQQLTGSPTITLNAGATTTSSSALAVNTYGAFCGVFNGASSVIQVGTSTSATGNCGPGNMGGFTLGAIGGGGSNWGSIQVKEVLIYSAAHDANTRAQVISYLSGGNG